MKTLPTGTEEPVWESRLVKDIAFIKRKLRYPIGGRTMAPIILVAVLTFLILTIVVVSIKKNHVSLDARRSIPFFFLFVPLLVSAARYLKTLRFKSIPTSLDTAANAQLIASFLKAQRLVTFRNSEVPEIFQIISRNISAYKEQREVMIFIADEGRILINSHFTNSEFNFVPAAPHLEGMANMLREWIRTNASNTDSSIVSINTF